MDPGPDPNEDRNQSVQSRKKESRASSGQKHHKNLQENIHSDDDKETRSRTRTWRSDPDRVSDGSFYSEDYENESPSERSFSPYSRSRTPSPSPHRTLRTKRVSSSTLYRTGVAGRHGRLRPQRPAQPMTQQQRRGQQSQSKESSPPKDLDLVTKRMLSARLLKINELRNALAELQQRTDDLQKENRVLRQLQVRQEKALQRYDDTESEISQLLTRHSNETQVLRERLRRTQERERLAERRLKDSEEQLQRNQVTIRRLKKLVDQRELRSREELTRSLEDEKVRVQEAQRRIRELERGVELSSSSFHRQLVAEKKKNLNLQEEIRSLQEELQKLSRKLKEKEKEMDTMNIYANRMMKPSASKEADSNSKRRSTEGSEGSEGSDFFPPLDVLINCSVGSSSKAVQTEDRVSSAGFPSPPPDVTREQTPDGYLTLKVRTSEPSSSSSDHIKHTCLHLQELDLQNTSAEPQHTTQNCREPNRNQNQQQNQNHQNGDQMRTVFEGRDSDRLDFLLTQKDQDSSRRRGHVQVEVDRWNQEVLANQQVAEEARRRKEQLLAKMREIDDQNRGAENLMFESSRAAEEHLKEHRSPRPPENNRQIFSLTDPEDSVGLRTKRRTSRPQSSSEDLAFGGYAPSFGLSASRSSSSFPPPPREDRDSPAGFLLREEEPDGAVVKDKKSSLMQQLFGLQTSDSRTDVVLSPPSNGPRSRREASSVLQVSQPAVRAVASFDEDLEELTL
ncbi:LOW QUALITY PROTEIN: lebercilin [Acanthochromis polyacanthus]|uniref:LOW QUALITY PROTEIN: lebercilin n=1 Tax=Acanthochromis polyacanthus TaxID=80966 RepID=UPI002234AE07|nr:LOW QUALITY PROTEIN: lebercilin [Acanthochromis polyacanthus]